MTFDTLLKLHVNSDRALYSEIVNRKRPLSGGRHVTVMEVKFYLAEDMNTALYATNTAGGMVALRENYRAQPSYYTPGEYLTFLRTGQRLADMRAQTEDF